jgi:hypothetical protein
MIQGEDGKLYRVLGGNPANLTPEQRTNVGGLAGTTVDVRGYLAYDKSCEGGCLTNGRNVTFTDGSSILGGGR